MPPTFSYPDPEKLYQEQENYGPYSRRSVGNPYIPRYIPPAQVMQPLPIGAELQTVPQTDGGFGLEREGKSVAQSTIGPPSVHATSHSDFGVWSQKNLLTQLERRIGQATEDTRSQPELRKFFLQSEWSSEKRLFLIGLSCLIKILNQTSSILEFKDTCGLALLAYAAKLIFSLVEAEPFPQTFEMSDLIVLSTAVQDHDQRVCFMHWSCFFFFQSAPSDSDLAPRRLNLSALRGCKFVRLCGDVIDAFSLATPSDLCDLRSGIILPGSDRIAVARKLRDKMQTDLDAQSEDLQSNYLLPGGSSSAVLSQASSSFMNGIGLFQQPGRLLAAGPPPDHSSNSRRYTDTASSDRKQETSQTSTSSIPRRLQNLPDPYPCSFCDEKFSGKDRKTNRQRHIDTKHTKQKGPWYCFKCPKEFSTKFNLKRHQEKSNHSETGTSE